MSKHKRRAGKTWLDETPYRVVHGTETVHKATNKIEAAQWRKKNASRYAGSLRLVKA